MEKSVLYLIFPCFNEEENIENSYRESKRVMDDLINSNTIASESKILFVDDGSRDGTWRVIKKLHEEDDMVQGLKLAQNRGHQMALYAGMKAAADYADAVITVDVDMQQDISAVPRFMEAYLNGNDIVLGVRKDRSSDGFFKKKTALFCYWLMKEMGMKVNKNSADYRLLSKKSVQALLEHEETYLFLRGLVNTLGFKTEKVYYDSVKRKYGRSKYSVSRMMKLALDGVTSFSLAPVHFILWLGIVVLVCSIIVILRNGFLRFRGAVPGDVVSLKTTIWFIGGVQLVSMGIIGEYVGRMYLESKHRPRYFIDENTLEEKAHPVTITVPYYKKIL